ncbi:MAG: potassium transporter TrkA, partial [Cyanobacteria bacterium RYN_339]|nr:potassium transporter TrkA [Cyanobacteria bacterium RYN_339]
MAKQEFRLRDRARYAFDNLMAAGATAQIGLLALLTAIAVFVATLYVTAYGIRPDGAEHFSWLDALWWSTGMALDPGTMGNLGSGWSFRGVMFIVTLVGIFVVSILIGILTTSIEGKLEDLRRGRSAVIERNHTLILGWSTEVFTIIKELAIANQNQGRGVIVILADKDKIEMETEIRAKVPNLHTTRVICRTGSPIDLDDLAIANPNASKSIIILSPDPARDSDSQVIKSILAVTNNPNRRPEPYHIVATIRTAKNANVAKMVGGDEVELVLSSEVVSRITVQTCLHSGLSVVYTELFDFDGDEIYLQAEPGLIGTTFGDALMRYEDSTVIGLLTAEGQITLNPPMATVIQPGDRIFAISQDDDTIKLSTTTPPPVDPSHIREHKDPPPSPKRALILGWNTLAPMIIEEMDHYVEAGSLLVVVADKDQTAAIEKLRESSQHQDIFFIESDTTDQKVLTSLEPASYDNIIVLSYSDDLPFQEADARTLITLLHLRSLVEAAGKDVPIVSEMLDLRNRDLAHVTRVDDFIVSSN